MIHSAVWEYYDPEQRMIATQKKHIASHEQTIASLRSREKRAQQDLIERQGPAEAWTLFMKAMIPKDPTITAENNELYKAWRSFMSSAMLINRGDESTPAINKLVRSL